MTHPTAHRVYWVTYTITIDDYSEFAVFGPLSADTALKYYKKLVDQSVKDNAVVSNIRLLSLRPSGITGIYYHA